VVAADGGFAHCLALGLTPSVVVGDLDSLAPQQEARIGDLPLMRVPRAKDQTDLQLALDLVASRSPGHLTVVGAIGGERLDHTLAGIHAGIALARAGWRLHYLGPSDELWLLAGPAELDLAARADRYLSLVPLTAEVAGVCASGLRWELEGVTLRQGDSLGISNEFGPGPAGIRFQAGVLAAVLSPRPV
jgi:thiamine pyrophosphokinase